MHNPTAQPQWSHKMRVGSPRSPVQQTHFQERRGAKHAEGTFMHAEDLALQPTPQLRPSRSKNPESRGSANTWCRALQVPGQKGFRIRQWAPTRCPRVSWRPPSAQQGTCRGQRTQAAGAVFSVPSRCRACLVPSRGETLQPRACQGQRTLGLQAPVFSVLGAFLQLLSGFVYYVILNMGFFVLFHVQIQNKP